jgi:hypothetical protein
VVIVKELRDRCRPQQRDIATEEEDRAAEVGQSRSGAEESVTGPELFRLQGKDDAVRRQSRLNGFGAVADDEHCRRTAELPGEPDRVVDQWLAAKRVENFRQGRFHPRPLAGRKNDSCQRLHVSPLNHIFWLGYKDRTLSMKREGASRTCAGKPPMTTPLSVKTIFISGEKQV